VQIFDHPETDRRLPPAKDGDAPEENAWPDRDTTRYRDFVQAFSHFTYEATQGSLLVCDLQGVFMAKQPFAESSRPGLDLPHGAKQLDSQDGSNSGEWVPTFRLTDPVIHDVSRAKARAAEDGWGIKEESEVGVDGGDFKRRGRTDRRQQGIADFFATHRCTGVCRALKLTHGSKVWNELNGLLETSKRSPVKAVQ